MDYHYPHNLAICTLGDAHLQETLPAVLQQQPEWNDLIVLPLTTENLGIEQIIEFSLSQPHLTHILLCGTDAKQTIGWLPGASLLALMAHGLEETAQHRIKHAPGKRPVLKNLTREAIEHFRATVTLVDWINQQDTAAIQDWVEQHHQQVPQPTALPGFKGPIKSEAALMATAVQTVTADTAIVSDPAGYVVISSHPEHAQHPLQAKHYTPQGEHTATYGSTTAKGLYMALIQNNGVSRLDHAAYLGAELARAEGCLKAHLPYTQDSTQGAVVDE